MIMKEMVLYYSPAPAAYVAKLKGVLVRMGIRIKNIDPKQINQKVGYLAGMPGFTETVKDASQGDEKEKGQQESEKLSEREEPALLIPEEMLVMKNFTNRRLDELLTNFRKAGVPKIALKAVITEQNSQWTFYQLYGELKSEHAAMSGEATN
ncbi:MAG: DUF3783 domain-containing protein [Hungatella sp.]|nr:DUF3783 domain-containing protein [Hungatella sp.]